MREVRRSALLPYTVAQMYELVADVERYPEFLPWCAEARVLERDGERVVARLGLARGPARASFTTTNRLVANDFLEMRLLDGPFNALEAAGTSPRSATPAAASNSGSRSKRRVR